MATETGAEPGDLDEAVPDHLSRSQARLSGEGSAQIGIVPAGRPIPMPDRSVIPALDTWDF